jgi:hypothetical protein
MPNLFFCEENFLQILPHWVHVLDNLSQLTAMGKKKHHSESWLPVTPISVTAHPTASTVTGIMCEKVNLRT